VLAQEARRDQLTGQDEECVDTQVATMSPTEPQVVGDNRHHRQAADTIEAADVPACPDVRSRALTPNRENPPHDGRTLVAGVESRAVRAGRAWGRESERRRSGYGWRCAMAQAHGERAGRVAA
jgi:hypothetical protein